MRKILSIFLLFAYSLGCSMDSSNNEGIGSLFPTPPVIPEENGSPEQAVNRDANDPPIAVEVFAEEAIVEPAVAAELVDNIAPQIVSSTVKHGDINVDVDIEHFVFTFSEDIAGANFIKLIDNTTGLPTGWVPFIRDKEIKISKEAHGFQLIGGHVYSITIQVADVAHNWTQPLTITFVTEFINFAAEEQAIRDLYAIYALAHGDQDINVLGDVWLRREERDVFTAWTFWAGTFEKNEGWKAVIKAWDGLFRLRGGKMVVDITYIAIDGRGKKAVLQGAYTWGNQKGDLISELNKDGKDWKIRSIDYTDGRFGKQVEDLIEPAHTFGEIPKNRQVAGAVRPPLDFAGEFAEEKAAIQAVYSEFYKAFNDNDLIGIEKTFRTNDGKIAFGTIFAGNEPVPVAFGWRNVNVAIQGLWIGIGTKGAKWGWDDKLTDFWIRDKGDKLEAAAIGYNCYKGPFPGETHLYLVKEEKDGWKIHELDSSTENNLGIFGFHKGKPRIEQFIRVTREGEKAE